MMKEIVAPMTGEEWGSANSRYLETEMERLRLLLRRRVLWLRKQWRRDAPQGYMGMAITDHEADVLLLDGDKDAEFTFYRTDADAHEVGVLLEEVSARVAAQ